MTKVVDFHAAVESINIVLWKVKCGSVLKPDRIIHLYHARVP